MPKTEQQTQAVFSRLTAADLKTLRAEARQLGTTTSAIIRSLTEAHLAELRAERKAARAAKRNGSTPK